MHLKPAERERLEALRDGVRLAAIPTEHRADELAAALHAEFPWMAPATEAVWQAMRRPVRCGEPGLRLPPLLLDGPPGIGKSHWARHLGMLLAVPSMVFEATVENASFGLVGSQRGWGNAAPGRLLNTMLQHRIGNPVVIVDEVEKAGRASSNKGQSFGLAEALLPRLEPISARAWSCPFYEVKFDMGWVIWVLTSNNWRLLPEPLLSRCPPLRLRELTLADLAGFVGREGAKRGLSGAATDAICAALEWAPAFARKCHPAGSPSTLIAAQPAPASRISNESPVGSATSATLAREAPSSSGHSTIRPASVPRMSRSRTHCVTSRAGCSPQSPRKRRVPQNTGSPLSAAQPGRVAASGSSVAGS